MTSQILKYPTVWLYISAGVIVASILVIAFIRPLWGIDFVGGSLIEIEAPEEHLTQIRETLQTEFDIPAMAQSTRDNSVIIRTPIIEDETRAEMLRVLQERELMTGEERRFEQIGPTIGQELRRNSITAITLVLIMMVIYLAYTFRSVAGLVSSWKFGIAAVYALVHDLALVTALFVIFGRLWGVSIDTMFVTAQLAILGYSVNDTIVLFNRVKWEWLADKNKTLLQTINEAMSATLGRSLNTSLTTLLVLVALLIFGGATIQWFIVALAIGTITGTYSSFFVAPPLLHYLSKHRS